MPAGFASYLTGAPRGELPTHPLTHHEILALIAPFTRRGRQADLDASNRIERRLIFKPIEHSGVTASQPEAYEVLALANPQPDQYILSRTLTLASGLEARLQIEGADPGKLLDRIEAVPPQRQFREIEDVVVALSYRLPPMGATSDASPPLEVLELTRGEATVAGLDVVLHADTVKGYPAQIDLAASSASAAELPDDLLAVIGWGWSPLRKTAAGWSGTLRARSREPQRSRDLEVKLEKTVSHLAQTLAQPPVWFHDTLRRARFVVSFRRGIPLLVFFGLMGMAAGLTMIDIPQDSIVNLLIMGTPPLMLFGAFTMRSTPSLVIPPWPRCPKGDKWQLAPEPAAVAPALAVPASAVGPVRNSPPEPASSSPAAEREAQCPAIP